VWLHSRWCHYALARQVDIGLEMRDTSDGFDMQMTYSQALRALRDASVLADGDGQWHTGVDVVDNNPDTQERNRRSAWYAALQLELAVEQWKVTCKARSNTAPVQSAIGHNCAATGVSHPHGNMEG